jgi:hypothetical protein
MTTQTAAPTFRDCISSIKNNNFKLELEYDGGDEVFSCNYELGINSEMSVFFDLVIFNESVWIDFDNNINSTNFTNKQLIILENEIEKQVKLDNNF